MFRKFYYYQNNIKYQIDLDEVCKCENYCYNPFIFDFSDCLGRKKHLFKHIFNRNLEELRKYNIVLDTECYKAEFYFEIRFHNDAAVPIKLLLLGGVFDAIFVLYTSNSEEKKPNTRHFTSVANDSSIIVNFNFDIPQNICSINNNIFNLK